MLYSAKGSIKIPKLLRYVFEKYENLDIDIFLSIFDFACTAEGGLISSSELLNMVTVYSDSQRIKVV